MTQPLVDDGDTNLEDNNEGMEGPVLPPGLVSLQFTVPLDAVAEITQLVDASFAPYTEGEVGIKTLCGVLDVSPAYPVERFPDVGGHSQVIAQLKPLVTDIRDYRKGEAKLPLPRGMLFIGEGGVGKTHVAKAFAGEAGCLFVYLNAGNLLPNTRISTSADAISQIMQVVRGYRDQYTKQLRSAEGSSGHEKELVIVFLDRFNAIAGQSERDDGMRMLAKQNALDALLQETDQISRDKENGVIIIAASDDPETLAPEVFWPGRFAHKYVLNEPETTEDRLDVLMKAVRTEFARFDTHLEDERPLHEISRMGAGDPSSLLRTVVAGAAERARREGRKNVTTADLYDAYMQEQCGAIEDAALAQHRRELVAYHEHGHALLALACGLNPLSVSMRPRGASLGRVFVEAGPLADPPRTRNSLLYLILLAAGGRAGEMAKYGIDGSSTGVSSDFEQMKQAAVASILTGVIDNKIPGLIAVEGKVAVDRENTILMRRICNQALSVASKVMEVVGIERFDAIAEASLAMPHEIYSTDARDFYMKFLDDEVLARMKQAVQIFLDDPIGPKEKKKDKDGKKGKGNEIVW